MLAGIDSSLEDLHDALVELVAEHEIFDARVDARVVVDLDEHVAPSHGLDVHAVEAVTDRVRGLERELDDLARRVLDGEGHWRSVDARLELAEALVQPRRTPQEREALLQADRLSKQGMSLCGKGGFAKALPLFQQALSLREEVLGKCHPAYATSLNNLPALYRSMGEYAKAEPLYLQARDLRKELLGERHPAYAASLNNLATLYESLGYRFESTR